MFDLTISETWTTTWGTKCGPPKLDHCNAPLYGYLTALWKGYSTSKWKKLPQLRKEANKDKYRFSSKLTDALNEEKSLCLARNWTSPRNCLRKEITYLLLLILFLMTFCSLIFWYNWWTSTMVTILHVPVWSYAICFYWWWYLCKTSF